MAIDCILDGADRVEAAAAGGQAEHRPERKAEQATNEEGRQSGIRGHHPASGTRARRLAAARRHLERRGSQNAACRAWMISRTSGLASE